MHVLRMARGLAGVVADDAAVKRGVEAKAAGTSSGLPLIRLRYPQGQRYQMRVQRTVIIRMAALCLSSCASRTDQACASAGQRAAFGMYGTWIAGAAPPPPPPVFGVSFWRMDRWMAR